MYSSSGAWSRVVWAAFDSPCGALSGRSARARLLLLIAVCEFLNFDVLIQAQIAEGLPGFAGGPPDLQRFDPRGLAHTNVLPKRGRPERTAGIDVPKNGPLLVVTVFDNWGIHSCEDIGHMVFNLIEAGVFGKTESDSVEDFRGALNFQAAFVEPFEPRSSKTANS